MYLNTKKYIRIRCKYNINFCFIIYVIDFSIFYSIIKLYTLYALMANFSGYFIFHKFN